MSKEKLLDQQARLLAIREHLRVRARVDSDGFEEEVAEACLKKVMPIVERHASQPGESIINAIAKSLSVRFEEITNRDDIERVQQRYLVEQRELGFGMLESELNAEVDALLFQRLHAHDDADDRWVAVLNLQESRARAYWSRPHELIHRIAEPPQQRLRFYRHKSDYENKLERLIDLGAAGLAFPKIAFGPLVVSRAQETLTWGVVQAMRQSFAPTASLQSVAKAALQHWPTPAILLIGELRAKRREPDGPKDLRVSVDGFSPSGETCGVLFYTNMRVPPSSVVMQVFQRGGEETDLELLSGWTTSTGGSLPNRFADISAVSVGARVYALVSPQ